MMIVFWVALIVGVVFLVRYLRQQNTGRNALSGAHGSEVASEILEKRYANGELSREEYLVMKADLGKPKDSA